MKSLLPFAAVFCITTTLLGCPAAEKAMDTHRFAHNGLIRRYDLYVPSTAGDAPMPLVVALHRFGENPKTMAAMTGFNEVAEREGFIVMYPEAFLFQFDGFDTLFWDDVDFVREAVARASEQHLIDAERVYITGASAGGFMVYALVDSAPELFAAAAPVMATMPRDLARPGGEAAPMPILLIHGTDDLIVPYDADSIDAIPMISKHYVLPVPDTVDYWVGRNNCDPAPDFQVMPDLDPDDGATVAREWYTGPESHADVLVYTVNGGGHTWPGGYEPWPSFIMRGQSRDINASEAIWDFFDGHRRGAAASE